MSYTHFVLAHLRKDLQIEWRAKDSINGMLFFSLLVVVVLAMAFDPGSYPTLTRQISGGLLWVGLLFAAMTALNQSWSRELRNNVLDAHRLAPAPASMRHSVVSTWPMELSLSVDSNTSSCSGTVPATNDVRPPWIVTCTPASRHSCRTPATSSAEPGRTRALACPR